MPLQFNYTPKPQWQVEQLVEEQVLQPLLPPIGAGVPPELLEKAANSDITLRAPLLQLGQAASSLTWLIGRSNSNFSPHLEQQYS